MAEIRLKSTGTIKLFENDNTSNVTIASPASLGADRTITLPDASVTLASGTMLATDGSGASLTALNASELGSGTVPTARLGSGTASSTTILYGDQTYKTEPAAGLTVVDQWRINATFSGTADPVTSNWEQVDTAGQGTLGSAMTESSGIFTFPSTGIYLVRFISGARAYSGNAETAYSIFIEVTINDSSYVDIAECHQCASGSNSDVNVVTESLVDVTDVANVKVRFGIVPIASNTMTLANSAENNNSVTFMRVGDT